MRTPVFRFSIAVIAGMGLLGSCNTQRTTVGTTNESRTLAYIGTQPVSVGEFRYLYEKNNSADSTAYSAQDLRNYLELFVKFKRKVMEARTLGYDTTREYKSEFEEYKKQLAKPYLSVNAYTDRMVKEAYQRLQEEINASHILISCKRDASPQDTLAAFRKIQELRRRALAGEDFGMLAATYSEDPSAKEEKGNLGYFTALQMVYDFETTAYNTPVGQISDIVRTQFGYHIVKVLDRRPNQGAIKVAHIMARFPERGTSADSAAALERIRAIQRRLKMGASWDSLCLAYSDDANSRDIGGELQWFSIGTMIPAFAEPAFQLKNIGDISEPVKTQYGWHLIKLKERRPIEPFSELEPLLRQKINKDSRGQISRTYLVAKLKKENRWVEDEKVKQLLLAMPDASILQGEWNYDRASKDLSKIIFTINGNPYLLRDAALFLENNQGMGQRPGTVLKNFVNELYEQFVAQSLIEYEEKHLAEKYPEYAYLINEYREGILLFKIMEERVWGKALTDKEGLQNFFNNNRNRYQWPDRAQVSIYTVSSAEVLQKVKEEYKKDYYLDSDMSGLGQITYAVGQTLPDSVTGKSLAQLLNFLRRDTTSIVEMSVDYTPRESRQIAQERMRRLKERIIAAGISPLRIAEALQPIKQGSTPQAKLTVYGRNKRIMVQNLNREVPLSVQLTEGLFGKGENPIVDATAWRKGDYELQVGGRWHWVIIHEVQPARLKELSETRGIVVADYQQFLEAEWLKELENRYPLRLEQNVFDQLIRKK
ncbi:peptidylprolyl isomerase [Rhodoflexus caldus]|uniref:peptidylprolyl isomerase n=1 Tax=Rhodoflexus caldus TaxID=2891236 RepID=UPI002029CAAC|nr:peptidylprolyl isomerase [Rhodoflexus caldus]